MSAGVMNLLTFLVWLLAEALVSGVVLYKPIVYGDAVENFGIVMMMTLPVIVAVTFRVVITGPMDTGR
jgi:hypothetical protein